MGGGDPFLLYLPCDHCVPVTVPAPVPIPAPAHVPAPVPVPVPAAVGCVAAAAAAAVQRLSAADRQLRVHLCFPSCHLYLPFVTVCERENMCVGGTHWLIVSTVIVVLLL